MQGLSCAPIYLDTESPKHSTSEIRRATSRQFSPRRLAGARRQSGCRGPRAGSAVDLLQHGEVFEQLVLHLDQLGQPRLVRAQPLAHRVHVEPRRARVERRVAAAAQPAATAAALALRLLEPARDLEQPRPAALRVPQLLGQLAHLPKNKPATATVARRPDRVYMDMGRGGSGALGRGVRACGRGGAGG